MSNTASISGLPSITETDLLDMRGGTSGVRVRSNDNSTVTLTLDNTGALTIPGPNATFPATLPAASAANLTAIPAANLTGTLPNATFPAILPAASATNLTAIPAGQLSGNVPTANVVGAYANVTTVGSATGLTVATGTPVKGITKYAPSLSPVAVAVTTTAEQSFTVTGITATDVVIAFSKPTAQAGLAIGGVRVTGANTIAVTFINDTALAITPTAAETYTIVALTF